MAASAAASCGETETPEARHTKGVAPLLDEIVNKSASDLDSIPLLIFGLRSHVESACCGEGKVWGVRECSRRQLRWNLNLSQPTSATVEQARDHARFLDDKLRAHFVKTGNDLSLLGRL
jgi:hypothetical protein